MNCPECNSECEKKWCSQRCGIRYRNRMWKRAHPRRLTCKQCGGQRKKGARDGICHDCVLKLPLSAYHEKESIKDKHPSWRNVHIRNQNRSTNKHLRNLPCQVCGYSLHVELAHIKPITEFANTAILSEVNAESNLLVLCRNHHWEFDHGILSLDQMTKRMDPTPGVEPGSAA